MLALSSASAAAAPATSKPAQPATKPAEVYTAWPFDTKEAARMQDETAKAIGLPRAMKVDLGGGAAIDFVLIPAGTYPMGDAPGKGTIVAKPFYLGKTLLTEAQFARVMGKNPSKHPGQLNPVDSVEWTLATEFTEKASEKTKKPIRLPTEAEWEWACRAGTSTRCYWGDDMAKLSINCWWHDNCNGGTNPVGRKTPNAFGLYDMMGNVWEWCSDGGPDAKSHPCRGTTFGSKEPMFKSSTRLMMATNASDRFGFRVAMDALP